MSSAATRHIVSGLKIVDNEYLLGSKSVFGTQIVDAPGARLSVLLGDIPAVDNVGGGKVIVLIVADDVMRHRMRGNGNDTASSLEVGDDLAHTVKGLRESRLYEIEPIFFLVLHLLLVETYLVLKKRDNAGVEILDDKALEGVVVHKVGTVVLEILYEGRIVDSLRAGHHGIVVVKY